MHSSPVCPGPSTRPVVKSRICPATPGHSLPTVETVTSGLSSMVVLLIPGPASVMPYMTTAAFAPITCFMSLKVYSGQGAPAVTHRRRHKSSLPAFPSLISLMRRI